MGPITLFDKSFLQSLSVDESVWFDHFFLTNVCPLFYGETLADLDKTVREGRTPEEEVRIIADKFPEMHGMPCGYHRTQCIGELLGYPVRMTGQVPLVGGRMVKSEGGRAAVFEPSQEADAFARWQRQEFLEIEHQYARAWRSDAAILDVSESSATAKALGVVERCKDLDQAKLSAANVVHHQKKPFEWLSIVLRSLAIPEGLRQQTLKRWVSSGKRPLGEFAPYTAHVLEVEVFFEIALASRLISSERASNRLDIAYLFYLPFCMMFVSNDRLHRRCAPLFLRPNQEFVWGPDLKANLGQVNEHFLKLPQNIREQGVYSLADDPPPIGDQAVRNLWSRLLPKWREAGREPPNATHRPPPTAKEIKRLAESPEMVIAEPGRVSGELDQAVIKRLVKQRKGSWYQIPASLNHNQSD